MRGPKQGCVFFLPLNVLIMSCYTIYVVQSPTGFDWEFETKELAISHCKIHNFSTDIIVKKVIYKNDDFTLDHKYWTNLYKE